MYLANVILLEGGDRPEHRDYNPIEVLELDHREKGPRQFRALF